MSKTTRSLYKQPSSTAPKSSLLISESEKKYKRVRMALKNEVQPQSMIEKMYFADITQLNWDIERYRRAKTAILNTAFRAALATILELVLTRPGNDSDVDEKAETLADQWFSNPAAKRRVSTLLAKYQLDGTVVEGQVMKDCASELTALDRLLASAESRRQKAIRLLAEYRAVLSGHVRAAGNEPAKSQTGLVPAKRRPLTLVRSAKKDPTEADRG